MLCSSKVNMKYCRNGHTEVAMDLFFSIWVITIIDKEHMYGKDMVQLSTECWLKEADEMKKAAGINRLNDWRILAYITRRSKYAILIKKYINEHVWMNHSQ